MIERLISFADPAGAGYGALALEGERAAAVLLTTEGDAADGPIALADARASAGEGAIRLEGEGGSLIVGAAAQSSQLGFEAGDGPRVSVQAIGASAELPDGGSIEGRGVAWSFSAGEVGAIRTAWALLADGSLLVLFASRAPGAADHGAERLGAARIDRDGGVSSWAEPLLSTEYDAAGAHVRATLELWGEEAGAADRGGGGRRAGGVAQLGAAQLAAARFDWRLGGTPGTGGYEIVS